MPGERPGRSDERLTVQHQRADVLLSADVQLGRRVEGRLHADHRDINRGADAGGRAHDHRLGSSGRVRRNLRVHLAGADVFDERILSADGYRGPIERRGGVGALEITRRPQSRIGREIGAINLDPGTCSDGRDIHRTALALITPPALMAGIPFPTGAAEGDISRIT